MAKLTINIKNNVLDETLDYLLLHFTGSSYKTTIPHVNSTTQNPLPDVPNPATKQDTVEKCLSDFIASIYQAQDNAKQRKAFEQSLVAKSSPIG